LRDSFEQKIKNKRPLTKITAELKCESQTQDWRDCAIFALSQTFVQAP
jgi:hypothetical protein